MAKNKITRRSQQESFVMVYHYMLESDLLTDNEFKLYLILLKYADSNSQCFPSIATLSKDMGKVKSQVQKLIKSLKDKGLLLVENRKSDKGDYTSNLYTILDSKKIFIPENKESLEATGQSNLQSTQQNSNFNIDNDTATHIKSQDTKAFTREMVNEIYDFEILIHDNPYRKSPLDGIMELILEVLNSNADTVRVNKEDKPTELVKSRFLKLNSSHINYVEEEIGRQTELIRNKRAYLITSLYNSYTTIDTYYTNRVQHDMYEDEG